MAMERKLAILVALMLASVAGILAFVPPIAQDPAYHLFIDVRAWLGVANFADVASNAAFVPAGLYGLWAVRDLPQPPVRRALRVFFWGVVLVGPGSAYYHLAPDNATLVWDRLPMTVAFMGLLCAVLAERVGGPCAGRGLLAALVALGLASVAYWAWTETAGVGDLRPYALVQFGSIAAIALVAAALPAPGAVIGWRTIGGAALFYAFAKVAEHFDASIFDLLGGALSGHTLKHLFAALAVVAVARAIRRARARCTGLH